MRAIFTRFENFMAMFVAMFAVAWSTAFMPLLGGPLHSYEARAIGAGWASLQSGQAATIGEAFEIATSLPAEAVFPSAYAADVPLELTPAQATPDPLELLGGPDVDMPDIVVAASRAAPRPAAARVRPVPAEPMVEVGAIDQPLCDIPASKQGLCTMAQPGADPARI